MKKLMFLTMVIGLMMVFGGSAAAQAITGNVVAPCEAGFKPKVNDTVKLNIFTTVNNSQGMKAYFHFNRGAKQLCTINLAFSQAQLKAYLESIGKPGKTVLTGKVTNAGNFSEAIGTGNLATFAGGQTQTITFARNKKNFGTVTLAIVAAP